MHKNFLTTIEKVVKTNIEQKNVYIYQINKTWLSLLNFLISWKINSYVHRFLFR